MELSPNADDITGTIARLSRDVVSMDFLLALHASLEKIGVFAYKNWENGELVDGPYVSRYWVESAWMWPYKSMPDPAAAARLLKFGCLVDFKEDTFVKPVRVGGEEDLENPQTRKAQSTKHKVWVVTLKMPRKVIDDELFDVIDSEKIMTDNEFNLDVFDDDEDTI